MIKFEISDEIVSIQKIGDIEPFSQFRIEGGGNLNFILGTNKIGTGFQVIWTKTTFIKSKIIQKEETFFFTESEMQDLFVPLNMWIENETNIKRNIKIEKIIK